MLNFTRILYCIVICVSLPWFALAQDNMRPIIFDYEDPPEWYPQENPFNTLGLFVVDEPLVLDHNGKPHKHGHVVQIIMDGGNGKQDPPNMDGTPSGDDSMAYGNFNMIRVMGLDDPADPKGASGKFYSKRFFIPYVMNRPIYLRIWEGEDERTAPYYQDSVEYTCQIDQGGAMIVMKDGNPVDIFWKFGPSKPRPKKS